MTQGQRRLTVRAGASGMTSIVLALMLSGTVACTSGEPPESFADGPEQSTAQPPAPTAQTAGLWDRLLAPEDFPLVGWSHTYTDSGEIPAQTAQPCGLELDPLLGDPDSDFDAAAVRVWTPTDAQQPETRVTTSVVESPGAESGVAAARAAVAACELEAAVPSEFGMLTLTPTHVLVTDRVGFCAGRLEMFQHRSMLGLTCHAAAGDVRVEIESLTPTTTPVSDADLQVVVDSAIETALLPR